MPRKLNKRKLSKKTKRGGSRKQSIKKIRKSKTKTQSTNKKSIFNFIKSPDDPNNNKNIKNLETELNKNPNSVNETDGLKNTALHYAADYGNVDATRLLIFYNADVNKQNKSLKTPLHMSIPLRSYLGGNKKNPTNSDNKLKILNLLLEANANPWIKDEDGDKPLIIAQMNYQMPFVKPLRLSMSEKIHLNPDKK